MPPSLACLACLASSLLLATAQTTDLQEITEDQLKDFKEGGVILDNTVSFRCGLFIIYPNQPLEKPISSLFIFNATFPAKEECDAGEANYERYKAFCTSAWDKGFKKKGITLSSPSVDKARAAEGNRVVDDICGFLKKEVKTPFVGKNSRKFPKGLEFAMFTNACGDAAWQWTGRTHDERVCCRRGKGADCPAGI